MTRRTIAALLPLLFVAAPFAANELEVAEGVVVKFGTDGQLVIRDGLVVAGDVVFTSLQDDTVAGTTNPTASAAVPGDWKGIRLERSSPAGLTQLQGLRILYGGGGIPAFTLARTQIPLSNFSVLHSASAGLSALGETSSALSQLVLTNNAVGFEAQPGATATLSAAVIAGNSMFGARNLDPNNPIAAHGIWWGHPTGPLDSSDDTGTGGLYNPAGVGNAVSDGVLYDSFQDQIPLFGLSLALSQGVVALQPDVLLRLMGPTATGVRLSENPGFPGVPFEAFATQKNFSFVSGDGLKTVYAEFQAATGNTAVINTQITLDSIPPMLTVVQPTDGAVLNRPIVVTATATDAAGVARVEFAVNDILAAVDTTNDFTFNWDVRTLTNGTHRLTVVAVDNQGRTTRQDVTINLALSAPPAPVITSPLSGTHQAIAEVDVLGTAEPGTQVSLLVNGAFFTQATPNAAGSWSVSNAPLIEGANTLVATSIDSVGTSLPSASVVVGVDTGAPPPPPFLLAIDLPDGVKRFEWVSPAATDVASYNLWRGTAPFATTAGASLARGGIVGLFAAETPPSEGTFYYGVTAVDGLGNQSMLSPLVQVNVDLTAPTAQVTYTPPGPVGTGIVAVELTVSENVAGVPFLSITPAGGTPTAVDLSGGPLVWTGNINVLSTMPTGTAAATYSARDVAGIRGTAITSGGTLQIDTRGPQGTLSVTPVQALYGPGTYTVDLTLDESAAADPVLRFVPQAGGPVPLVVSGAGTSWQASLDVLSSHDDGTAVFELDATDALGNATSGAIAGAQIEIDVTPPGVPGGLVATARPGGEIRLVWSTLQGAASYSLYRVPQGQPIDAATPVLAAGLTATQYDDLPASDGGWTYAVTAVDGVNNESGFSTLASATSDGVPPGDPTGLLLTLEGLGIRADWTPTGAPADSFSLYRSTAAIVTLVGLQPVQTGLTAPTALDLPPADGDYFYAVVALDTTGNMSALAAAGPLTFDQAGPQITVGGVTDGQVSKIPLTITYSAMDFDLQSLDATLNGAPFTSGSVVSTEGDYTLVVDASDGSANATQETVGFAIDLTAPVIVVSGVAEGVVYESPVAPAIVVTESRPGTTTILLNGAAFTSGTSVTLDSAYVLTVESTDQGGNSANVSVNFSLDAPPPRPDSLSVELNPGGVPMLSWTMPAIPDLAGFLVRRNGTTLTPTPIVGTTYADTTFDPFLVQVYDVVAVDTFGHESAPRTATLSRITLSVTDYGTALKLTQSYIDRITVSATNTSGPPLPSMSLQMTLRDGATVLGTRTLASAGAVAPGAATSFAGIFATGAGAALTRSLDLVLTLPGEAGTQVRLLRSETLQARVSPDPIQIFNDPLVLGANGSFRLKVYNHGSAAMQVVTSRTGSAVSDVEAALSDLDGNLLGVARLDQTGAGTTNTANLAFAEISPGGSFLTGEILIPIPSAAGNQVRLATAVDLTHSDLLGFAPPDVTGSRLSSSAVLNTGQPAYLATAMTDKALYDEGEPVEISGSAFNTTTALPEPNAVVKIGINTRGFDRFLFALTDANGDFTTTFEPVTGEAGHYSVWATHPTIVERSSQATFDILGLALSPRTVNLRMSKNSTFPIALRLTNSGEVDLSGIAFQTLGGSGVTATIDASALPATLAPGKSATVTVSVHATIDAVDANFLTATITSAEGATRFFDVSIALLPAVPVINTTPSFVEVGVPNGLQTTRTVRIENRGFAPLENIVLELPELPWITLGVGPSLPPIPVGGFADVPVIFTPPADLTPGIYSDRFTIVTSNHTTYRENLFAVVTSSTTGEALFEVRNTENVLLNGASVWIQNLQVPTLTFTLKTGADGTIRFQTLPSGPYQYRVEAPGTEPSVGRFDIEPDRVTPLQVFNNVVYVTLDWSVTPILIEDRYEFTVAATFETSVPAPVLITEPAYFQLKVEPGSIYVGEYKLRNFGLVGIDDVKINPSAGNGATLETLITELPRLGAMQTVTVPFRLTLPPAAPLIPGRAADGPNPCEPTPAAVHNIGIYICLAGFGANSSAGVNFTISSPEHESLASQLGLCDDECNICDCLGPAGGICNCLTSPSACSCLGALPGLAGDAVSAACDCYSSGLNSVDCIKHVPGPIGSTMGLITDVIGCVKCLCKFLPSVCDFSFGGGTTNLTGGNGGGGGGGGYGVSYGGVSSNVSCDDPG